jgi:hypothetical protein
MNTTRDHLRHARALRDDILAAPSVWLPRRAVLLEWLDGFVRRAELPAYDLGESEAADLADLDQFLRKKKVPSLAV